LSATGINPEDIIIDGDGFITTDTSHGPEELVQGQLFDTLDIKVYHTPSSGGPNVYVSNYKGDGITNTYLINHIPGITDGILALVNNIPVDISINYKDKIVTFTDTPFIGSNIVIIVFDTAGYDILDKQTFIGDGATMDFATAAPYSKDNFTLFITVDGIEVGTKVKSVSGKIVVQFNTAPVINSIIQIIIFSGSIQKYSKITNENIPVVSGQKSYTLSNLPANIQPLSAYVFVVVDGEYLSAPDYKNYVYDGNELQIIDPRYFPYMLDQSNINVYVNGILLTPIDDFVFDSSQNLIVFATNIGAIGDEIVVEIIKSNDYQIIDNQLILTGNFDIFGKNNITLTTFTNHDILKTKRTNKGFTFATGYDLLGYDSNRYDLLTTSFNTSGIFDLPRTVTNTSGVFVILSHKILSPNVDYVVLDNRRQVKVILPDLLYGNDYIEIITTNDQTVRPSFGFKIFKDMLNRTSYKALDKTRITTLVQDFNITDTSLTVSDGTILTTVINDQTTGTRLPGIIEINGERIEYFVKNGNVLSQLRRGTLGTSVSISIPAGTPVYDNGSKITLPYTDTETKRATQYGDGENQIFDFDFVPEPRYEMPYKDKIKKPFTYKETIPDGYYPCDGIEVYVAGRRLIKDPIYLYDQNKGQDSYKGAGDKQIEAEFSVDGINKSVRLTVPPNAGELVVIIAKQGKIWQKPNENLPLVYSTTDIARFLNTKQVDLPK